MYQRMTVTILTIISNLYDLNIQTKLFKKNGRINTINGTSVVGILGRPIVSNKIAKDLITLILEIFYNCI
ncbi:hypothetical protein VCHA50O407_100037 [Vibrio chagasii]|nr:hypothetical protein VCHA50O407_100037 [Vibrio chagasii]CAH7153751.1 hypothetical protein VCHA38O210_110022 [Vibrio chagasii]CAH7446627.1 hypothetical protein VCHA50P424_90156 [Vibrio chagasii]